MTPATPAADRAATQDASLLDARVRVSRFTRVALGAGVAIVVGAGIWGISAPRGEEALHLAAVGESLGVPGGIVRVERTRDTSLGHAMPGMDFAGQQEPGKRRYAVTVALQATGAQDLAVDPAAFLLEGDGLSRLAAFEDDLGTSVLPAGMRLSFTLVYEIPEAAEHLVLVVPGAAANVGLTTGGPAPAHGQRGH